MAGLKALLALMLAAATVRAATVTVNVIGLSYGPPITIQTGDTVQWNNLLGHNVAQTNNLSTLSYNGGFYSGGVSAVSSYSFQFNIVGTYFYFCEAHGSAMTGSLTVVAPTPTPTACETPTPSPSFSVSPTHSDSPTITNTPNPSDTITVSPTLSPSFSVTATFSPSPSPTQTAVLSPTPTPVILVQSFAGVGDARLLASPISGDWLRLWARLQGLPQGIQLKAYSAAGTVLLRVDLPPGAGEQRWTVDARALPAGPVWLQLWVLQDGEMRKGPVLRSYVIR